MTPDEIQIEREREQGAFEWLCETQRTLKETPANFELVLGAMRFLGLPLTRDNLLAVHRTLVRMGAPLEQDVTQQDRLWDRIGVFPSLQSAGVQALTPFCPSLKALAQKELAARILAEKRQREADAATEAPAKGRWLGDMWIPDGAPMPANAWQGAQDLAGMQRASRESLNDLGKRTIERQTVR